LQISDGRFQIDHFRLIISDRVISDWVISDWVISDWVIQNEDNERCRHVDRRASRLRHVAL